MKHEFEKSSSIKHCDYDEATDTMEIAFTSGAVYHYPNCGKAHYEALKAAASPGQHFHRSIRKLKSKRIV